MPLFLAGAVSGLLGLFGIKKAVDNVTTPPAATGAANTAIPWTVTVPLMIAGTIVLVIVAKKVID